MTEADHRQDGPWRAALELAWEAYRAGTIPVGAVITDGNRTVLATGRNRINDTDAPAGHAGASKLVEREIEATDRVRTFPMTVDGPAVGATALLAELFVVSHFVERRPDHHVTDALRLLRPELVVLGETIRLTAHVGLSLEAVEAVVFAASG